MSARARVQPQGGCMPLRHPRPRPRTGGPRPAASAAVARAPQVARRRRPTLPPPLPPPLQLRRRRRPLSCRSSVLASHLPRSAPALPPRPLPRCPPPLHSPPEGVGEGLRAEESRPHFLRAEILAPPLLPLCRLQLFLRGAATWLGGGDAGVASASADPATAFRLGASAGSSLLALLPAGAPCLRRQWRPTVAPSVGGASPRRRTRTGVNRQVRPKRRHKLSCHHIRKVRGKRSNLSPSRSHRCLRHPCCRPSET